MSLVQYLSVDQSSLQSSYQKVITVLIKYACDIAATHNIIRVPRFLT